MPSVQCPQYVRAVTSLPYCCCHQSTVCCMLSAFTSLLSAVTSHHSTVPSIPYCCCHLTVPSLPYCCCHLTIDSLLSPVCCYQSSLLLLSPNWGNKLILPHPRAGQLTYTKHCTHIYSPANRIYCPLYTGQNQTSDSTVHYSHVHTVQIPRYTTYCTLVPIKLEIVQYFMHYRALVLSNY